MEAVQAASGGALFDCRWHACEGPLARYCKALMVVDVAASPQLDLTIVPHDAFVVSVQFAAGADPMARGVQPEMLPQGCAWREVPQTYRPGGNCRTLFALLTPEGAIHLSGGQPMPQGVVPRQPLAHWLPRSTLVALVDALALQPGARSQLQLFGKWLEDRMVPPAPLPWQARRAARVLETMLHAPACNIEDVARTESLSRRQLERDFRRWLGTSPKHASLLGRVQAAARLGWQGHALADVAHRLGFVDQSHMSHVVRKICNVTPATLARAARTELGVAMRHATGGALVYL